MDYKNITGVMSISSFASMTSSTWNDTERLCAIRDLPSSSYGTSGSFASMPRHAWINFESISHHTWNETDCFGSIRDLPNLSYGTGPCITIMDPGYLRPLVFSHIEVYKMVESMATELRQAGVHPQSACAFILPNSVEAIVYFLALQWIGAAAVPVDPGLDQASLEAMLKTASAVTVVSPFVDEDDRHGDELYQKVSKVCKQGNHVHWMINRSMNKGVYLEMCGRGAGAGQQSSWADDGGDFIFDPSHTCFHLPSVPPAAGSDIQISHGVATDITRLFVENYNLSEEKSTLLVLPFHSIHGLISVLSSLTSGGNIVVADMKSLNVDSIVEHISTLRLNWLTADANLLVSLFSKVIIDMEDPKSSPLKSLSFIRCVGRSIDTELLDIFTPLIGGPILQSCGTSEVCIFDEESGEIVDHGNEGWIGVHGGDVVKCADNANKNVKPACVAGENGKPFFLTGNGGRVDGDEIVRISSLISREERDSTALVELPQAKIHGHGLELEVDARRKEENDDVLGEKGTKKRVRERLVRIYSLISRDSGEGEENRLETICLEEEEMEKEYEVMEMEKEIKNQEERRMREEEEHHKEKYEAIEKEEDEAMNLEEKEQIKMEEWDDIKMKGGERIEMEEEEGMTKYDRDGIKEEDEDSVKDEEEQGIKCEEEKGIKEEEEELPKVEEECKEEDGKGFKGEEEDGIKEEVEMEEVVKVEEVDGKDKEEDRVNGDEEEGVKGEDEDGIKEEVEVDVVIKVEEMEGKDEGEDGVNVDEEEGVKGEEEEGKKEEEECIKGEEDKGIEKEKEDGMKNEEDERPIEGEETQTDDINCMRELEIDLMEENKMLLSRLEVLEATVRTSEEIFSRLSMNEVNQNRLDEDIKGQRLKMEKMMSSIQKIDSAQRSHDDEKVDDIKKTSAVSSDGIKRATMDHPSIPSASGRRKKRLFRIPSWVPRFWKKRRNTDA